MLKLITTKQDADLVNDINHAVLEACRAILINTGIVAFEQALIATQMRKSRDKVQWNPIQRELGELLGRGVITVSGAELLRQTKNQDKPLRLTKEVTDALKRVRGNCKAGFCFPASNPNIAYRHITSRRHVADGLYNSADSLEGQLPQIAPIPPQ